MTFLQPLEHAGILGSAAGRRQRDATKRRIAGAR